ncbi:hypothetical protein [Lentzea tibetensis]|uniref:hypothetical protein n=1 Tax=Lentzea tibetensis TaxID=2591470 RepID=UPI0016450C3F|nr:hypothetical protein [Lentzea tibetensis]
MIRLTKMALLGSGLAIAGALAAASPASATTPDERSVVVAQPRCSGPKWYDAAGPGGAHRAHATCNGVYVKVTIYCADGSQHTSAWRWGYAKAECPYATAHRGTMKVQTKRNL